MIEINLNFGFPMVRDGRETKLYKLTARSLTAGDVFDAQAESEMLMKTPDGYQLLTSDSLLGLNTLRRQIVSIDDHPGPLSVKEMQKLDASDLNLILGSIQADEALRAKELLKRGRPEAESPSD